MNTQAAEPKYPLQTLSKALEVLEYMKQNHASGGITLSAVSKDLNISKSSAHRILDTLLHYGFVEKSGTAVVYYQLSWAIYRIGRVVPECHTLETYDCKSLADALAGEIQRGIYICVRRGPCAAALCHALPPGAPPDLSGQSVFSRRFPLYATASGKLFMLDFKKEEILHYFQTTDIRRYAPNTILNYIDFLEHLERIREQGYATDDREYHKDEFHAAMPIRDCSGNTAAAISVVLDPDRAAEELPAVLPKLSRACDVVSEYLGCERAV